MSDLLTGFQSAKLHAQGMPHGSNMKISASLVTEMCDLIEQQQARIDMLEEVKAESQRYSVELEQRIAEIEDKRIRELNRKESELQGAFSRIDELAVTVERLRNACQLGVDMFVVNNINVPNTIETMQVVIEATPHQNLNAINREVAVEAYKQASVDFEFVELGDIAEPLALKYANQRYPD